MIDAGSWRRNRFFRIDMLPYWLAIYIVAYGLAEPWGELLLTGQRLFAWPEPAPAAYQQQGDAADGEDYFAGGDPERSRFSPLLALLHELHPFSAFWTSMLHCSFGLLASFIVVSRHTLYTPCKARANSLLYNFFEKRVWQGSLFLLWYFLSSLITCLYHDLLAQLGEHHLDRVGVSGSSPLQIIAESPCVSRAFSFFFILSIRAFEGIGDKMGTKGLD